ncbi:HlyC/CorC family transporter [Dehalogenimonas alkenigignens]|uniref:Hemolysin or related protein containing CBS domain n=1 Tax=Dehalogenimonas alkenigignens TaxID=1217799 RepID=A0A0W0GGC0_9CHLR|nr:hemolysin family protein [Dehalogenimonas alkenigignens]KTB47583.1 Hemolysin or related protein containing CBS domain [Dehalogenimonas alkenigignens]PVV82874.1 HlyC/CorC family transporter [Dehalogenimonas alkenigignens]
MENTYLILLVICLLLSAFFSSSETAFISLSKFRLQTMLDEKVKGADIVARLVEKPERLLSTVLLGNNFVNIAASALATVIAIDALGEEYGVLVATIALTVVILIFAEVTPKTVATRHSEKVTLAFARPISFIAWLFAPGVAFLSWIASGFMRLFGGGKAYHRSLFNEEEIRSMIDVGHKEGTVEMAEAEMLHAVFDFRDRPVSEVLVPRPEVVAVEKGSSMKEFFDIYEKSPMSRFPVYEENMDNVVGILSIKDVLMAQARGEVKPDDLVDGLMRPAYFAPESKPIGELFNEMRDKNFRMCVVIDEHGGTAGVVSLSRLMEEIVGPVGDELSRAEKDYESINEYTFQVDGGMRVNDLNEELELNLPEGEDYETVAGFIMKKLGQIPRQGQVLRHDGLKLVVTRMRGKKIEDVLITKEKKPEQTAATSPVQPVAGTPPQTAGK